MPSNWQVTGAGRALASLHTSGGRLSRSELTRELGYNRASIGELLSTLVALELVEVGDSEADSAGPGRPSPSLSVSDHAAWAAALQLEADGIAAARVDIGGRVGPVTRTRLGRAMKPADVADALATTLERLARGRCIGATIAVPGLVAAGDEVVASSGSLSWTNVPLAQMVRDRLGMPLPLQIGNDANLAAVAEQRWGAGHGARNMLYVTSGRVGIGGALVSDGELFAGASGLALEIGHIPVVGGTERCSCGSVGCLIVEADARALARHGGEASRTVSQAARGAERVLKRDSAGDKRAGKAVDRASGSLASALASAITLLDPDAVVLSGLPEQLWDRRANAIEDAVVARSIVERSSGVPIRTASVPDAVLVGAGDSALKPLFTDPRRVLSP